jgi:hypothetical protein
MLKVRRRHHDQQGRMPARMLSSARGIAQSLFVLGRIVDNDKKFAPALRMNGTLG